MRNMFSEHALYRAVDVRDLERRAIERFGLSEGELMARAGAELFVALRAYFPAAARVLVLCGGGNNGGDGYVAARLAKAAGLHVTVCALADPAKLTGAAADACQAWHAAHGRCESFSVRHLDRAEVVIDALLGTGLDRDVAGAYAEAIAAVNAARVSVVAADTPSGLHADTGAVLGTAMRADVTVTFVAAKAGLFTGRGPALAGEILVAGLDVPAAAYADLPPLAWRLDPSQLVDRLRPRERDAHKGDFGHVVLVGGGPGMPGAVRLAGEAALRAGAGKVTAGVLPGNVAAVTAGRPELMCHGIDAGAELEPLLRAARVLAAGPGLGQGEWSEGIWKFLRHRDNAGLARVLDADGLNWLCRHPLPLTPDDVITPHPGEAARLLDCEVADIARNRYAAASGLAVKFNCVAVLKGAGTIVAAPDGRMRVCDRGNPGMASAGMGDVLTGIIAAFRAQGMNAFDAACAGVLAHAVAADRAAQAGERGLLAGDLLAALRTVVNPTGTGQ